MKTFEQRVITRCLTSAESLSQMLQAWESRLNGAPISLDLVSDRLHDSATVAESIRPSVTPLAQDESEGWEAG